MTDRAPAAHAEADTDADTDTDTDVSDEVVDGVRRGRRSGVGHALARGGMASRAVVYGALAAVVVQLAVGARPDDADQAGALTALGAQPAGVVVLWLLVVGVACYALWRFTEVVAGPTSGEDTATERLKAGLEGVAYIPVAVVSASIALGDPASAEQGDKYRTLSATVVQDWPAGRWLVGAVGVVVLVVGAYLASEGPRLSFRDDLRFHGNRAAERVVVTLGSSAAPRGEWCSRSPGSSWSRRR